MSEPAPTHLSTEKLFLSPKPRDSYSFHQAMSVSVEILDTKARNKKSRKKTTAACHHRKVCPQQIKAAAIEIISIFYRRESKTPHTTVYKNNSPCEILLLSCMLSSHTDSSAASCMGVLLPWMLPGCPMLPAEPGLCYHQDLSRYEASSSAQRLMLFLQSWVEWEQTTAMHSINFSNFV